MSIDIEHRLLSAEEERALLCIAHDAEQPDSIRVESEQTLVRHNLLLVAKLARRFRRQIRHTALTVGDLISEGTLGLIRAVRDYDLAYTCRLSTFAFRRIARAMHKAINRDLLVSDRHRYDTVEVHKVLQPDRNPTLLPPAVAALPEQSRRMLVLRFGLDGERPHTFQAMAPKVGMSSERCRQLVHGLLVRLAATNNHHRRIAA